MSAYSLLFLVGPNSGKFSMAFRTAIGLLSAGHHPKPDWQLTGKLALRQGVPRGHQQDTEPSAAEIVDGFRGSSFDLVTQPFFSSNEEQSINRRKNDSSMSAVGESRRSMEARRDHIQNSGILRKDLEVQP
jgi:hypothetical protein